MKYRDRSLWGGAFEVVLVLMVVAFIIASIVGHVRNRDDCESLGGRYIVVDEHYVPDGDGGYDRIEEYGCVGIPEAQR